MILEPRKIKSATVSSSICHEVMGLEIARERERKGKKERERGNYTSKNPNLRQCQACSQNKGLSKHQRRASRLRTGPSPTVDKQAGGSQSQKVAIVTPERHLLPNCKQALSREASSTKLQAGSIANQEFLGFWMVDTHWEGRSQRSAPQKRHTEHLRRHACCTPRKVSSWDGEVIRYPAHLGVTALAKHLVT